MPSASPSRSGSYLRTKWASPRRIRFWLLLLVILYAVLGFFAAPWLVKSMVVNTVEEDFERNLQIESVYVNPFTLTLSAHGGALNDIDDQELLRWDRLFINLAWSSIFNEGWTIKGIRLDSPTIKEEMLDSGDTRFSRLVAAITAQPEPQDEPSQLALQLNDLHITDGVIHFSDNLSDTVNNDTATSRQVLLTLQDIELSVENFALHTDSSFPVRLEARHAAGGMLAFDGTLYMQPAPALEGHIDVDDLALIQAAPYLAYFLGVQLESGALSFNGQLQTNAHQPLALQGSAGISSLLISQAPDDETLLGWRRLHTAVMTLDLNAREIETDIITIDELAGQVIINEDQTTNFGQLSAESPAQADIETAHESEDGSPDTVARTGDERSDLFSIFIEGVELNDSGLEFSDDSLPLPFSTSIHTLNGDISAISSTSAEPARIQLEGEVEEYGLARAAGAFYVLQPTLQSNINLTFRNIRIPEYSPYTAEFAGRTIAGGIMDLDLDYLIENRQLNGENNLMVRGIELGEKIDEDAIPDWPLNLAIALLEDNDGVIELSLQVTGEVDDPDFDFTALILQALGRAVTTVIETPFALLASALGIDSADLVEIEFAQGRTDLSPPQRQRVEELRKALSQRPTLVLEFAGPFSRTFDGPTLKHHKAVEALRQSLTEAGQEDPDLRLTSTSNQAAVEALFTSYYPESDLELVRARFTEGETEFDALAYRNYLANQVVAIQPITEEDLEAIANARATAVRDALVNNTSEDSASDEHGITADRVRILEPEDQDSVEEERITMEIEVPAE